MILHFGEIEINVYQAPSGYWAWEDVENDEGEGGFRLESQARQAAETYCLNLEIWRPQ